MQKNQEIMDKEAYLFTTKSCPNCKLAKTFLDESGVKFKIIDAEEDFELAKKFSIRQAPTLVVINNKEISRFFNVSNIKQFAENQ